MTKLKIFLSTLMVLPILVGVLWVTGYAQAQSAPSFRTGDIATGTNNTRGNGSWSDPVSARPGEAIEFRIVAQNMTNNSTANNVVVRADLPSNRTNPVVMTGHVSADNAAAVSDTVTVNIEDGSQQGFAYIPGHTRIFSSSCPNGCAGPDTVTSGINVGNLAFGESAQVLFKAYVTNIVSPNPTPTPTPGPGVSCPNVQFVLPATIQPNSDFTVRVNTSGGQNWAYVTLWKDGARVPTNQGADLGGGAFQWNVNSGAAGSNHSLTFRVNDFDAYPGNGSGSGQECGSTNFTTGQSQPNPTPTPTTPVQGGTTTNNNTNTSNNSNNNSNTNNNSATGGQGGTGVGIGTGGSVNNSGNSSSYSNSSSRSNVSNSGNSTNVNIQEQSASSSASATGGTSSSTSQGGAGGSSTVNLTIPGASTTVITLPGGGTTSTTTTAAKSTTTVASAATTKGAPKVVAVAGNQEVVELPKTGLPLLAWGLAGLLPAGLKLRGKKNDQSDLSANSLWEERQFKI